MKVITPDEDEIVLGTTETRPTISIRDFSRRVTDDFGVTRVVKRNFQRLMSVRMTLPFDSVSDVQNSLAALRATAAQWVASEDYDWLNFSGFYKDFSLDLAVPPNSFCTLTVEGLAESEPGVTDAGTDPAPTGTSTLKLVQPTLVDDSVLVSSNVPETDWPEWSAITIYPAGARVIKAALHRVYESVVDTNVGNDPAGDSGKWTEVGPTNRWAMFDEALGTATSAAGNIVVTVNATAIDSVALIDVDATTVRVEAAGYDETRSVASGSVLFLDLPPTDGDITVTVTKSGGASVGTMLIGKLVTLGVTEESPTAGITDYSKKEVDDFGEATIVERAWAKRSELRSLIRTDAIDIVANRVAAVRAQPSLWIGDEAVGALIIYGFFKDFSIEVDQAVSTVSLSIEGLSKAAPISDAGATAVFEKNFYRRSATQPATPSGGSFDFVTRDIVAPADWSASIEVGDDPVWVSIAIAAKTGSGGSAPFTGHTVPVKVFQDGVDGADGAPGTDGAPGAPGTDGQTLYTHYAYADSLAPDYFNFTTGAPGDRVYQGVRYNQTSATESTNPADYAWSPYVGPPNFGLAAFDSNSVVAGNKLIKVAGGGVWNASVHSTESFKGGASVTFVVDDVGQFMVGLNSDPTADANYSSLDFAIYSNASSVKVYESGVMVFDTGVASVVGDVFTVTYNNKSVVYSKNGVPFYTNNAPPPNLALFLDSSLLWYGVQLGRILSFTAAGPAGSDGVDGSDGTDGADGTDGQPGLTISASPPVVTVARTAGGLAKSGELPKSVQVQVLDGDTDVTASCSFSKADTGSTWSNDGGGSFTLTSISAEEAYTIITATYGSRDPVPIKISVAQPKDGSAASRATANVTSMNASGTYTAIATVDIVAAAGATISGNASTTYLAASFVGTGTRTVRQQAKVSIQNLTDGGAEVDGVAQIGSAASYIGGDGPSDVGQVSASNYVTNSSGAPKTFRLKFYIRKYDGATNVQTAGGTYSGNIEAQVA